MGYSQDESAVRVDFFKESGKWYTTEAVQWVDLTNVNGATIMDEFRASLEKHLGGRLKDTWAVCLEPYHARAFPLMMRVT